MSLPTFPQYQIAFHPVQTLLEAGSRGVHVRDHASDVAHNRCEYQHSGEKVYDNEQILNVPLWLRSLPDRRQRQRRPVERVDVHAQQRRVDWVHRLGDVEVDPVVAAETDPVAHLEIYARVPVDDHEDVEEKVRHSEQVRVVGTRIGAIEELLHTAELEEPVEADVGALDAD